ncbi:hypothetical protein E2C01_039120 [Portunus trituberculatus]|uniref:Uncharacterized protein n=1 Tax=Portunus trituberculatus TaxID=210409 RepID=A0A5B7FG09_PORTR|nr:hypothetical protein [Portunus trituberculatus]
MLLTRHLGTETKRGTANTEHCNTANMSLPNETTKPSALQHPQEMKAPHHGNTVLTKIETWLSKKNVIDKVKAH